MNDTIQTPTTDQSGAAPVNAFVAALAEQVFQRVAATFTENVKILINEALVRADPTEAPPAEATVSTDISLTVQAYVREQIETALDSLVTTYKIDSIEEEVESAVENYLDRNLDVSDAVSEALDDIDLADKIDTDDIVRSVLDNGDFDEKVKEIVQGMTFEVSVS